MQFEPYYLHEHYSTVMWNVAGTHTHETNGTQLHAHRQSESKGEKVGAEGRIK